VALASATVCSNSMTGMKGENSTKPRGRGELYLQSTPDADQEFATIRNLGFPFFSDAVTAGLPGCAMPATPSASAFLMDRTRPNNKSSAVSAKWACSGVSSKDDCISSRSATIALGLKVASDETDDSNPNFVAISSAMVLIPPSLE